MRQILIIEDNVVQAAACMRDLRGEGFVCSHSGTMADGLSRLQDGRFDCLVLDLGLPDMRDDEETISHIPALQEHCPVVVLTGSGDPSLVSKVRRTGAAILQKLDGTGTAMLIEKVWSQINYQAAGRDSELGQMDAQRRVAQPRKGFTERTGPTILLALAILTAAVSLGGWLYRNISDEATKAQVTSHRLDALEKQALSSERSGTERDGRLVNLEKQAQVSIDDRAAIRSQFNALLESQREHKADIIRRLERIEDKLDRAHSAGAIPPPKGIAQK